MCNLGSFSQAHPELPDTGNRNGVKSKGERIGSKVFALMIVFKYDMIK